jgi:hypothetical protein
MSDEEARHVITAVRRFEPRDELTRQAGERRFARAAEVQSAPARF